MVEASLLVTGSTGLIGHEVVAVARDRGLEVIGATTRLDGDLSDPDAVRRLLERARPDAVVNCAGMVKQRPEAADAVRTIRTNSVLPHALATACRAGGVRLVHVSTDCVFSGDAGERSHGYSEADTPDARDLYGRSKLAGEVTGDGICTVRTSVVGAELHRRSGLLEWLLSAQPPVRGWTASRFSGLAAPVLAERLVELAVDRGDVVGVRHIAAEPITKYDLLVRLSDALGLGLDVERIEGEAIDRRLDGRSLDAEMGWSPPTWDDMAEALVDQVTRRREDGRA